MRTIELSSTPLSLPEVLALAHLEPLLLRTASGEEFVVGAADDFQHEVDLMAASPDLTRLLEERSHEKATISIDELRKRLS